MLAKVTNLAVIQILLTYNFRTRKFTTGEMFNFNFNKEEEEPSQIRPINQTIQWYQSERVKILFDQIFLENTSKCKVDYGNGLTFTCLSSKDIMNILKTQKDQEKYLDVLQADSQHSDLLVGKYEGGLKTWECTKDLAIYFNKYIIEKCSSTLVGKSVLDLGCGTGILGILCLKYGAFVTFQDYNKEVLQTMTMPNVMLNYEEKFVENKAFFFSGDWMSFLNLIEEEKKVAKTEVELFEFDYILTSETIYNPENYEKLIEVFKKLLKKEGVIFLAAKTHYFGVGGSIYEFEKLLKKNNFNCCTVWKTSEGISREILQIKISTI